MVSSKLRAGYGWGGPYDYRISGLLFKNICGIVVLGTSKWVYCCIKENHLFNANLPCLFSVIPAAVCMLLCLILVVIL